MGDPKEIIEVAGREVAISNPGLDRLKGRHPEAAAQFQPADILADSMRGRSSTWTRLRLNLPHIPPDQCPEQETLEVDYDPWNGMPDPRKISGESSTS